MVEKRKGEEDRKKNLEKKEKMEKEKKPCLKRGDREVQKKSQKTVRFEKVLSVQGGA